MKWIDEHVCSGDALSWFHVDEIPDGLTLEQAVEWVASNKLDEHGTIVRGRVLWKSIDLAKTLNREIVKKYDALEVYKNEVVTKIEANGGWGYMTYYITTDEKAEPLTPPQEEVKDDVKKTNLKEGKMGSKVDMSFSVDIEDVYSSMSYKDQQEFIKSHINDIGGLDDVVEECFYEDDVIDFVSRHIDEATDEALIGEINDRGLEV